MRSAARDLLETGAVTSGDNAREAVAGDDGDQTPRKIVDPGEAEARRRAKLIALGLMALSGLLTIGLMAAVWLIVSAT